MTEPSPSIRRLTVAVRAGNLEPVRVAYQEGVDGKALVLMARAEGSIELLQWLVERGAAPELVGSPLLDVPGLARTVEAFVEAFESAKPKRSRTDVEAWIVDGDPDALQRLAGTELKKAGLQRIHFGYQTTEPQSGARCLALLKAVMGDERLLDWIARESAAWLDTYRVAELGGDPGESTKSKDPSEANERALKALAERLRGGPRFRDLFRAFDVGPTWRFHAWQLCGALGASERDDGGKTRRSIRWIDGVAVVRERNKVAIHIFDDASEFEAFVSGVPAIEQAVVRGGLRQRGGYVCVFVDATLDPRGTGDGKGGPLGFFDHDCYEAQTGTADVLHRFSRAATFAGAAMAKATELGLEGTHDFVALFDHHYDGVPGRAEFGWFLGAFPSRR
jgi:hypothetical protein